MATQKRPHTLQAKISDKGWHWIEHLAAEHSTSRSEVLRAILSVAAEHETDVARRLGY